MDHETDGGPHGARGKALAGAAAAARRADRAGARHDARADASPSLLAIPLLALVTFVQLLYLESLRLRTRDLPSLEFFKDTLEDKLGLKTEEGAGCVLADQAHAAGAARRLLLRLVRGRQPWHAAVFWQAALAVWLTMLAVAATRCRSFCTGAPRAAGCCRWCRCCAGWRWIARPCAAVLTFFQSLVDLADDERRAEEPPTPAENIDALISAGTEEGLIEEDDRKLIQSVVEFGDKVVREVMTPRPNIVAISADATLEQLRQLVITRAVLAHPGLRAEHRPDHRLRARARHVRARRGGARQAARCASWSGPSGSCPKPSR